MDAPHLDDLIPAALLERVQAQAAVERRGAAEIVREAIEKYLQTNTQPTEAQRQAAWEAGQRILQMRKGRRLPEGETIKSLIEFGRA